MKIRGIKATPINLRLEAQEADYIEGLILIDKILVDSVEIPKEATAASSGYF